MLGAIFVGGDHMWQLVGWIVWGIIACLAISFSFGCRSYAKSGHSFQWATGVQTFFWWIIAILFLIFGWNKLHILWIGLIAFFSAQHFALGTIPILSPLILFATRMFLRIILIGIEKPLGAGSGNKIDLIRSLAKKRIRSDSFASKLVGDINNISETMLMSLPEATIVTIVETYWQLKNQGLSVKEILESIENHRASFGDSGILPSQLTLPNYIKYRIRLEHSNGAPISDDFIDEAVQAANEAFTL